MSTSSTTYPDGPGWTFTDDPTGLIAVKVYGLLTPRRARVLAGELEAEAKMKERHLESARTALAADENAIP